MAVDYFPPNAHVPIALPGGYVEPSWYRFITSFFKGAGNGVPLGTAAGKAASNTADANLASVNTPVTVNHVAQFADTAGTIKDGGVLGTAASKAASDNTKSNLASVSGTITANHVAQFADTAGTVQDGGVLGTAAAKAASDNTKANLASVSGATTASHFATFADTAGTVQDYGATIAIAQGGTGQTTARAALQALSGGFILGKSGNAVSAGNDVTEDTLATITVPANAMGANGVIKFEFTITVNNNANAKTVRMRFSGASGTIISSTGGNLPNTTGAVVTGYMANQNATNSQAASLIDVFSTGAVSPGIANPAAIDTTAQTTIVITGQKGVNTDTITLNNFLFVLWSDGT